MERISEQKLEELMYMKYKASASNAPIHIAAEAGFTEFIRRMLNTFPSLISAQNEFGNTPVHVAVQSSRSLFFI